MVRQKVDRRAREVVFESDSNREFFLIHGYTGSPTDFKDLGEYLHKKFNASVKIMRLIGHGEEIRSLDSLNYSDFLFHAEKGLRKSILKKREVIVGGLSVGGLIALDLVAKYPVKGVFCVSPAFKNKPLLEAISFLEPVIPKKHWVKKIPECEKELRKKAFFYGLHLRGLRVIKQGKKSAYKQLSKINAPFLAISVSNDSLFSLRGVKKVMAHIGSNLKKEVVIDMKNEKNHNPFYSSKIGLVSKEIYNFVKKNNLFS